MKAREKTPRHTENAVPPTRAIGQPGPEKQGKKPPTDRLRMVGLWAKLHYIWKSFLCGTLCTAARIPMRGAACPPVIRQVRPRP